MAYFGIVLSELIAGGLNSGFIRRSLQLAFHSLMEADIVERCQAERGRHAASRANSRSGHRLAAYETCAGQLHVKIPKLRHGAYFPGFLEKRGLVEQALIAVIHAALFGTDPAKSTEELHSALTAVGMSTQGVHSLCAEISARVTEHLLGAYTHQASSPASLQPSSLQHAKN
jgi:transposase-like protein